MTAAAVHYIAGIGPTGLDADRRISGAILVTGVADIGLVKVIKAVAVGIRAGLEVRNISMAGGAADTWQYKVLRMLAAGRHAMVGIRHLVGVASGAGGRITAGNGIPDIKKRRRSRPVIGMAVVAGVG